MEVKTNTKLAMWDDLAEFPWCMEKIAHLHMDFTYETWLFPIAIGKSELYHFPKSFSNSLSFPSLSNTISNI